jgi:hypothetical protein
MTAAAVEHRIDLESLFGTTALSNRQLVEAFAVLNLGLVESFRSGVMRPTDGVARFYYAANCLYVRRKLKNTVCDDIMGRGVQLPDLFDALPPTAARRQFGVQLDAMSRLCLKLLRGMQPKGKNGPTRAGGHRRAG